MSSMQTNLRGYVFGLTGNEKKSFPSPIPYGGKVLADHSVANAAYQENVQDFYSAFVYEFPSLRDAMKWHVRNESESKNNCTPTGSNPAKERDGPMVILEGKEFGDAFHGFSVFFIKVHDKESFSKYNPDESLQRYRSKRSKVLIRDAPVATGSAPEFDTAVLIAFPTPDDGKEWLESEEYKPQGKLRMAATSGHGIVIGKGPDQGDKIEP